jgi:GntR family transcriptional regulator
MQNGAIQPARTGRSLSADAHAVRDMIWSLILVEGDLGVLNKSEEVIAKEYNVSRNAVRLAFSMLVSEGAVTRRRGIGTVLAADPVQRTVDRGPGMSDEIENGYQRVQRITLSKTIVPSSPLLLARFGQQPLGFLRWERTTYVDDSPYCIWTSYLPLSWAAPLIDDHSSDAWGMFKVVSAIAPKPPTTTTRRIQAISADARTSIQLGTEPGFPVVHLERSMVDADGACLELSFAECRSDRFMLTYSTTHS